MLIVIPDAARVLRDRAGQAYNEYGQKIDEQGNLLPNFVEGVDRYHQGVARYQGGYRAAAVVDGRAIQLDDYNMPDMFFASHSSYYTHQAHLSPTSTIRMECMLEQILKSQVMTNQRIDGLYNDVQDLNARFNTEDVNVVQSRSGIQHQTSVTPLTTACHTDLQNHSTPSLNVDRHDLDVDRHSSETDNASTFEGAKSSGLDSKVSTTDDNVDEQWTDVELAEVHGTSKNHKTQLTNQLMRIELQRWCRSTPPLVSIDTRHRLSQSSLLELVFVLSSLLILQTLRSRHPLHLYSLIHLLNGLGTHLLLLNLLISSIRV